MNRYKNIFFCLLLIYFVVTFISASCYTYNICCKRHALIRQWDNGTIKDYTIEFSMNYSVDSNELSNLKIIPFEEYYKAQPYDSRKLNAPKELGDCEMKLIIPTKNNWLENFLDCESKSVFDLQTVGNIRKDGALVMVYYYFDNNDKRGTHFISWDYRDSIDKNSEFRRFMKLITMKKELDIEERNEWLERMRKKRENLL